tara:strand:+ start:2629 stop:4380 length:1752 start_codon:yes stop_codon:yes gene_type:complete
MAKKNVNIKLGADITQFQSKMKRAQKSFAKTARKFKAIGQQMSMSLTAPLVAFGAASVKAFDQQAKAEAALNTALGNNEQAFRNLTQQAKELQEVTLFGDEETIAAQTMLATMQLEENAIKRLIPLIQDMATAKGMNLKAAADLVAKSVGSSTNALSRYGIEITGAVGSTERLESAVESLSTMFGGQAVAAAESGAGAFKQLSNAFGDFMENVGKALMPLLEPLRKKLKEITDTLSSYTKEQLTAKIQFGLWIAAIGPALIVLGSLAQSLSALAGAFLFLSSTAIPAVISSLKTLNRVMKANPYLFLAGLLMSLGVTLVALGKNADDAEESIEDLNDELDRTKATLPKTQEELNAFNGVFKNNVIPTIEKTTTKIKEVVRETKTAAQAFMDWGETMMNGTAPQIIKVNRAVEDLEYTFYDVEGTIVNAIGLFTDGFVNLFQKINDVNGGLMSFRDKFKAFAKDFIGDMIRMVAKAALFAAVMALITGGGSAAMASTFKSSFNTSLFGQQTMQGLPGMASGGPVLANQPYIVGEQGPELFMSGSSGTIIPNHALGGGSVIPDVRISGNDLLIVFDKQKRINSRR